MNKLIPQALLAGLVAMMSFAVVNAAEESIEDMTRLLKLRLGTDQVEPATATGVDGVYQTRFGNKFAYLIEGGRYVFIGDMVDLKMARNMTEMSRRDLIVQELAGFDQSKQIVFPAADEELAVLNVFTDTSCGYCQQLHKEVKYLQERRTQLGGYLPARRTKAPTLQVPTLETFKSQLDGTGEREASTTMSFVRILAALTRDKQIGKHIVPIVPDEARTFGREGMFRQIGIYASKGQLYEPVDAGELMYYRGDKEGQILEEGINAATEVFDLLSSGWVLERVLETSQPSQIFRTVIPAV